MITLVFSIYDSKAKVYSQPFHSVNVATACRSMAALVNDRESQVARTPEDFTLFQVATFDDVVGVYVPLKEHHNLGIASNFKEQQ